MSVVTSATLGVGSNLTMRGPVVLVSLETTAVCSTSRWSRLRSKVALTETRR